MEFCNTMQLIALLLILIDPDYLPLSVFCYYKMIVNHSFCIGHSLTSNGHAKCHNENYIKLTYSAIKEDMINDVDFCGETINNIINYSKNNSFERKITETETETEKVENFLYNIKNKKLKEIKNKNSDLKITIHNEKENNEDKANGPSFLASINNLLIKIDDKLYDGFLNQLI